jgi:hypothetical protein
MWGNYTKRTHTQGDFYFSQNDHTMNFYFKVTGRSRREAELFCSIDTHTHTHFLVQMWNTVDKKAWLNEELELFAPPPSTPPSPSPQAGWVVTHWGITCLRSLMCCLVRQRYLPCRRAALGATQHKQIEMIQFHPVSPCFKDLLLAKQRSYII